MLGGRLHLLGGSPHPSETTGVAEHHVLDPTGVWRPAQIPPQPTTGPAVSIDGRQLWILGTWALDRDSQTVLAYTRTTGGWEHQPATVMAARWLVGRGGEALALGPGEGDRLIVSTFARPEDWVLFQAVEAEP